jgi:hypothetical protein
MAMHPPKGVTQLLEKWSNGPQYAVSLSQVDRFVKQPDVELLALHDALKSWRLWIHSKIASLSTYCSYDT